MLCHAMGSVVQNEYTIYIYTVYIYIMIIVIIYCAFILLCIFLFHYNN